MGLFRRKASTKATEPVQQDEAAATSDEAGGPASPSPAGSGPTGRGPYDSSEVSVMGPRVDLGSIWLPVLPGLKLRMEVDKKSQNVTGVAASLQGSVLQIQAFAAPRSAGIWDEVREEIAASLTKQGGAVDDLPGVFGRELLARIPAKTPDGKPAVRPARFIGHDGPRWFLRGVLSGQAAVDPEAAKPLESVFANIVVVRDNTPRPPRDLLSLTMPQQARQDAPAPSGDDTTADEPSFDPLTRGPEITEIR